MAQFIPHRLSAPPLSLSLLPYGLTFNSLLVELPDKTQRDLIVGYEDPKDHHFSGPGGRGFRNQTVGRYANRLPSGRTEVDGVVVDLKGTDGVCLHGGGQGLDTQAWTHIDRANSALFPANDSAYPPTPASSGEETIYRIVSPAGADGFPLELEIEGLVVVVKKPAGAGGPPARSSVAVVLRAKVVDDGSELASKGTPVNLTVHWGFNLGSFAAGESEDIKAHKLWMAASRVTALDSRMLPTGKLDAVAPGHAFNFEQGVPGDSRTHRTIGENFPADGIDHNIVFNQSSSVDSPKVVLTSPDSKVSLSFRSNQSTVQTYTAGFFDGSQSRKKERQTTAGDRGYDRFGAIFLEFHHPIATFLHPELIEAAGTKTILKPGEVYENFVEMEVKVL